MSAADGQEGADRHAGLAAALLVNGDLGGVGDLAVDDDLEHTHLHVRRVGGRVGVGGWRRGTVPGAAERRRAVELTAREAQIAWLAAGGLANPEIGTGLFLSDARSGTTWARCSPSWASPPAPSSAAPCPAAEPAAVPVGTGHMCWPGSRFARDPPGPRAPPPGGTATWNFSAAPIPCSTGSPSTCPDPAASTVNDAGHRLRRHRAPDTTPVMATPDPGTTSQPAKPGHGRMRQT
jgi:hypothetical protein